MKSGALYSIILLLCAFSVAGQTNQQIADVQAQQMNRHQWGYLSVSGNPGWMPVTTEEATGLEDELSREPENTGLRIRLMNYYWHNGLRQRRAVSVFWLIQHQPESPILGLDLAWLFPNSQMAGSVYGSMHDDVDFVEAQRLWEAVIPTHLNVPEALHNAARFFEATDPAKTADLATRLQLLDPQGHSQVVAYYFEKVEPGLRR